MLQADTRAESQSGAPAGSLLVPGLTILHHPDIGRVGERVTLTGLVSGRSEELSRTGPAFSAPGSSLLRPLADPYMSRRPLRFEPGDEPGGVLLRCGGSGTATVADGDAVTGDLAIPAARVERGVVLLLAGRVVLLLSRLDPVGETGARDFGLIGASAPITALRREIQRVGGLDVPVLLRGETGTGKELVARALHDAGPRRTRPYVAVNMAAVPATLAAAELFGAARGAYTGAERRRDGSFQRADGGTLFLDEVGETPQEIQALLLRALESHEIQPVGDDDVRRVDVRLIAATDADLEGAVTSGRFRAPFLHRLAGYEIRVPPLRERRDDFGGLFLHFVRQELAEMAETGRLATSPEGRSWIPAPLVARLAAYEWPGNVRQLRNAARQLVIAGHDAGEPGMWLQAERILQQAGRAAEPADGDATRPLRGAPEAPPKESRRAYRSLEEVTDDDLLAALRANRWRIQRAAAQLGISRGSLYDRIERSQRIRKAVELSREEIETCRAVHGGDLDAMVETLEVSKRGLQRRMNQLGLT
ncbi:MAG TPA: sigma 54-interacting transcriptional regulator [Thermoanaerobaculia bacterium]|nr:sigma 54-interacting transcriptional regulator [Thermoanaerobaculia bacterium]